MEPVRNFLREVRIARKLPAISRLAEAARRSVSNVRQISGEWRRSGTARRLFERANVIRYSAAVVCC
jgi:hypothetical protein